MRFAVVSLLILPHLASSANRSSETAGLEYGVVYDAGSVHTTVSVYAWNKNKLNGTGVVKEIASCEIPVDSGISSFSSNPRAVKDYILDDKCMPQVLAAVPRQLQKFSPIYLGGTAGMRVLNATEPTAAAQIIGNLSEALDSTPFDHDHEAATAQIVSGTAEGILGWISSNYLSNVFGTNGSKPVPSGRLGALDWGGASSQITFEVGDGQQRAQPSENMHELSLYGQNYTIFTSSHLCYGQAEAVRRYFVELVYQDFLKTGNVSLAVKAPCQPKGATGVYTERAGELFHSPCTKYKDAKFRAVVEGLDGNSTFSFHGQSDMKACESEVEKNFDLETCRQKYVGEYCLDPEVIPRPMKHTKFLAFSTYWYLVSALRFPGNTSAEDFEGMMAKFCASHISATLFLKPMGRDVQHNSCFRGLFMHRLLTRGYHFHKWDDISFVKRVSEAEVGWTLGYMIQRSNTVRHEFTPYGPWETFGIAVGALLLALSPLLLFYLLSKYCPCPWWTPQSTPWWPWWAAPQSWFGPHVAPPQGPSERDVLI